MLWVGEGRPRREARPACQLRYKPEDRQLLAFRWRRFVRLALVPDVSAAAEPELPDVPELPEVPEAEPGLPLGLLPLERLALFAFVAPRDCELPLEVERPRDVPD